MLGAGDARVRRLDLQRPGRPGARARWLGHLGDRTRRDPRDVAVRLVRRDLRRRDPHRPGAAGRVQRTQRLRLRAPRRPRTDHQCCRRPLRAAVRGVRAQTPVPPPGRRPRTGRDAWGRGREPTGQQLLHPRRLRGRCPDRLRGAHAGRQLVVVPAPQARRGDRDGERARGDLLLRGRRRPRRPWHRLPARLRPPGQGDRRAGRGPQRRRGADPVRLARPVDRRPRLRPLLPQRDGRSGRRARLADLRRPGPRLGPRHLGRPGGRLAAAVREGRR